AKGQLGDDVEILLIRNDAYFDRDGLYGDHNGDYPDNLDRFSFFSLKILKMLKELKWQCDIIHCHDWHTALIPVYLKTLFRDDPFFQSTKTVLTIHNLAFQGLFPKEEFPKLGLPEELYSEEGFRFYDQVSLLKAGIIHSDEITTVSPQYATDIQTEEYGCGLNEVMQHYQKGVVGILNGLDYSYWNPTTDKFLPKTYDADSVLPGKLESKMLLQKQLNLPVDIDRPLFGYVGRLSHQKGVELIIDALSALHDDNLQIVIQGMGTPEYQAELTQLQGELPQKLGLSFEFNERLAHIIYAGSDWFLMPSNFEPCGLTQMISMHYGTPPIVYRTGGLADTVEPFHTDDSTGNGLVFQEYSTDALLQSIRQGVEIFQDKRAYLQLLNNAMGALFPWRESARNYYELYRCLRLESQEV
ncbi:MAG: glycogen synthase, partial [Candidatus Omnitrophica bacterium]|nr:glycogen synthase [Candidatus Omnitrophota bacterium]